MTVKNKDTTAAALTELLTLDQAKAAIAILAEKLATAEYQIARTKVEQEALAKNKAPRLDTITSALFKLREALAASGKPQSSVRISIGRKLAAELAATCYTINKDYVVRPDYGQCFPEEPYLKVIAGFPVTIHED